MHDRLKEILETKKSEIRRLKTATVASDSHRLSGDTRNFKKALTDHGRIELIAEIKFGSPSAGVIRNMDDPVPIGIAYEKAGAAAISFLTDRDFFNGDIQNLPRVKNAVSLPVLRKDFILDELQVHESARFGADAILLIARILSETQLKNLIEKTHELRMDALVEIHDERDLKKALKADADIIGINNRNLETFEINLRTTFNLAPLIPRDRVVVCESGIKFAENITALKSLNIQAVLVGTALMGAGNPGEMAKEMVLAGKG